VSFRVICRPVLLSVPCYMSTSCDVQHVVAESTIFFRVDENISIAIARDDHVQRFAQASWERSRHALHNISLSLRRPCVKV
jgi:hypothetical protein